MMMSLMMNMMLTMDWCPETATKAYIDTVKLRTDSNELSTSELISAMAAGTMSRMIVEFWTSGASVSVSAGLAIASHHTGGQHLVTNNSIKEEYKAKMSSVGIDHDRKLTEIMVDDAVEVAGRLSDIDFLVIHDGGNCTAIVDAAELSEGVAVVVCKGSCSVGGGRKGCDLMGGGGDGGVGGRAKKSVHLPIGRGIEIMKIGSPRVNNSRWIKHVDWRTGEVNLFRS